MFRTVSAIIVVLLSGLSPVAAAAQTGAGTTRGQASETVSGIVASIGAGSLVVETDVNEFVVFRLERDTDRPATIARGSRVTVVSRAGIDASDTRIAMRVTVMPRTPDAQAAPAGPEGAEPVRPAVPAEVRRIERQIERQAKRFGVGVRGGVALDPELVTVGVHARVGPFFTDNLSFRPNVEFAFGEVTGLFAINLEAVYQLPATRQGRWTPYLGGGPSFTFIDRGFATNENGREIDFDEFTLDGGFSVLAGVEYPNGAFIELKGTAYTIPNIRLLVGFTF